MHVVRMVHSKTRGKWNGLTHQLDITNPFSASVAHLMITEVSWSGPSRHPNTTKLLVNWATENASAWHETNQYPMGLWPNLTKHQKQRLDTCFEFGSLIWNTY